MWGESGTFALRPGATLAGTIRMTRAVARVDVGVNFHKDEEGHFPLDDMQAQGLYNGGKGTYFEPSVRERLPYGHGRRLRSPRGQYRHGYGAGDGHYPERPLRHLRRYRSAPLYFRRRGA